MIRRIILLLIVLSSTVSTVSGQQDTWEASTDATEILENGVFRLQFTLRNADGSQMKLPSLDAFEVLSGPSSESSISIINGKRTTFKIYSFTLMAKKKGKYTIDPASIVVGQRTLRTKPIVITVVEGKPGASVSGTVIPSDEQVFIRAEMDTSVHYPGEQVILKYKLYTTVSIRNYRPVREDDYDDFIVRYVKNFGEGYSSKVIDGVQYRVQTLKSVALFPSKPGTYTIEPFIVNVGIGVKESSRRSFFFNTRSVPKTVKSEPLEVRVLPLPDPKPEGFTGAVGQFAIEAIPEKTQVTTDDALVLNVRLANNGDARRWSVPTLDYLSADFEVYEPNLKEDKSMDERGVIINRRSVQYLMIPREPGRKSFTVNLPYFNPDSARYVVLRSNPITVDVTKGAGVSGIVSDIGKEEESASLNDIIAMRKTKKAAPVFVFSPLFFVLGLVPIFYVFFVWRRKQADDAYAGLDPAERKRLEARNAAMKHLESAQAVIAEDSKKYYEELSDGLFTYISGKLSIPHSEISKERVRRTLVDSGLEQDTVDRTMSIVGECELALYAGAGATDPIKRQGLYDRTVEAILSIEAGLEGAHQ